MTTKNAKNMKFRTKNSIQILRDLRALCGEEVFRRMLNVVGRFAQAAKTLKHCNMGFAEFGEFFNQELVYSAPGACPERRRRAPPRCNLRALLHIKA